MRVNWFGHQKHSSLHKRRALRLLLCGPATPSTSTMQPVSKPDVLSRARSASAAWGGTLRPDQDPVLPTEAGVHRCFSTSYTPLAWCCADVGSEGADLAELCESLELNRKGSQKPVQGGFCSTNLPQQGVIPRQYHHIHIYRRNLTHRVLQLTKERFWRDSFLIAIEKNVNTISPGPRGACHSRVEKFNSLSTASPWLIICCTCKRR